MVENLDYALSIKAGTPVSTTRDRWVFVHADAAGLGRHCRSVMNGWNVVAVLGGAAAALFLVTYGAIRLFAKDEAPKSYEDCVLKYMPQAKDAYVARQIKAACEKQFPFWEKDPIQ